MTVTGGNMKTKNLDFNVVKNKKIRDILSDEYQEKNIDWSTYSLLIQKEIYKNYQIISKDLQFDIEKTK